MALSKKRPQTTNTLVMELNNDTRTKSPLHMILKNQIAT